MNQQQPYCVPAALAESSHHGIEILSLTIRQFRDPDADQVAALWNVVLPSSQPWNEPQLVIKCKQNKQPDLFFVGELNGRIVSTVMAGYDGHRGWIYSLAVSPQHRRQGIGRRMMARAEQALRQEGCLKLNLQVRASNDGVVAFYESLGFVVEERISMGKPLSRSDPIQSS